MNILKKSALGVCVTLLFITLLTFGLAFGLHRTFNSPDQLKTALKDSGIYQTAVSDVMNQVQKEQKSGEGGEQIPVDDPAVKNAIQGAVSPELLQKQTEQALDSVYAWLKGESPKLAFSFELGEVKQNLANGLAQHVEQRAAALPACGAGTPVSSDFDAFNATCLPRGTSPAQVAAQAKDQVLNGEFLKEDKITVENLKGEDGKSLEDQLAAIPEAYKKLSLATYLTGLTALLLAAAVVLLSVNWRSGLKKVSIIFIVVGSLSAAFSWLAGMGVEKASEFAKEPLQQSGVKVAQQLSEGLREWWMFYGIGLLAAGIVTLIVLHFTKPKALPELDETEKPAGGEGEAPVLADGEKPKVEATKKPKPVKKLVQ